MKRGNSSKYQIPKPARGKALTRRQKEILNLLKMGIGNKEIAIKLNISSKTVKNHLTETYERMGVLTRTEAVVVAMQKGLIC